jgi:hypothetical protein
MKTVALLALIILTGWGVGRWRLARQTAETIRRHGLELSMTEEQVRQSLGEPNSRTAESPTHEFWYYQDRAIEFVKGRLIDSHPLAPMGPHGAPASAPGAHPTPPPQPVA